MYRKSTSIQTKATPTCCPWTNYIYHIYIIKKSPMLKVMHRARVPLNTVWAKLYRFWFSESQSHSQICWKARSMADCMGPIMPVDKHTDRRVLFCCHLSQGTARRLRHIVAGHIVSGFNYAHGQIKESCHLSQRVTRRLGHIVARFTSSHSW